MSLPSSMTFAEAYERLLVDSLFRPFADELLNRVEPKRNGNLLDVACGTGIVARLARRRLDPAAQIVGVDSAPGMLDVARRIDPTIDWRDGNAMKLPVGENEQFSIVTCHQGVQFFPDKPAALREMRRVLRPEGRLGLATWRPLADIPFFRELDDLAQKELGPFTDSRHSFGDAKVIKDLLVSAGFGEVTVQTFSHDVHVTGDSPAFARLNAMAVAGMSPDTKGMDDQQKNAIVSRLVEKSLDILARYSKGGTLIFSLATNIAVAH